MGTDGEIRRFRRRTQIYSFKKSNGENRLCQMVPVKNFDTKSTRSHELKMLLVKNQAGSTVNQALFKA